VGEVADACAELGIGILVVEDQFHGPQSVKISQAAGIVVGAVAYAIRPATLTVVWVPAQTWQWAVLAPPVPGQKRARLKGKALKAAAQAIAARDLDGRYSHARAEEREGIADAWCMARWWAR